jgi:hypothetical protein
MRAVEWFPDVVAMTDEQLNAFNKISLCRVFSRVSDGTRTRDRLDHNRYKSLSATLKTSLLQAFSGCKLL